MKTWIVGTLLLPATLCLNACTPAAAPPTPTPQASVAANVASSPLAPLPGKEAPQLKTVHRVEMETDAGKLTIEVYPEAAPNAAQRFLELVKVGFFDGTPIGRVVKSPEPFVAQFGVNPKMKEWKEKNFNDDPTLFSLDRGTLCFAKAGPNTNSTQVFINFRENNQLADPAYNFTVFGKVVNGMEAADAFKSVGDPGMGLDQTKMWEDPGYLKSLPEQPTMIKSMKQVS